MLETVCSVSEKSYYYASEFCADVSQDMEMVQLDRGKLKIEEKKIELNEHISIHKIKSNKKIFVKQDVCQNIIRFNIPNINKSVCGLNVNHSCMSTYEPNKNYTAILPENNNTLEIEVDYPYFESTNQAVSNELKKNDKELFVSKIPPDIQSSLCVFSKYLDKFEDNSCSIKSELCEEIAISFIEKILSINIFYENQYSEIYKSEGNWKLFKDIIDSISIYRECISISDIINRHNIQQRSLFNLFKKYIGISPSQYLLAYKLCAAQSNLVRERCFDDPVTRAAVDSEFYHLGRFSQYYKTHFGHLPSETVNRVHDLHSQSRHSR